MTREKTKKGGNGKKHSPIKASTTSAGSGGGFTGADREQISTLVKSINKMSNNLKHYKICLQKAQALDS